MTTSVVNYTPHDEYERMILEEWYTKENRRMIVKMAITDWKKRHGTKPIVIAEQLQYAMCHVVDNKNYKRVWSVHNLRIIAAEALQGYFAENEFISLNGYDTVQRKLQTQELPDICGTHFIDKQNFKTLTPYF